MRNIEAFPCSISTITIDAFIEFHQILLINYLEMIKRHKISLIKRLGFLIFGISLLFLFTLLSFYMSYKYVVFRLKSVSEGIKKIGEGDLSTRIFLEGRDEITEIVKVLNASLDELEKKVKEIEYLYRHDPVTGASNREKLLYDLKAFSRPVLLLIDINSFKSLNFVYGIEAGNIILKQVYQRLKETFGSEAYRKENPFIVNLIPQRDLEKFMKRTFTGLKGSERL